MIKPGTLCYILNFYRPIFSGRIVTAVAKVCIDGAWQWHVEAPWLPSKNTQWLAWEKDLRPIHGPDAEQSIRETDTVRDHDEITRRLTA